MSAIPRLRADDAVLVIVDVQEKLFPLMDAREATEDGIVRLAKGARLLAVPIVLTEQYRKGLGPTIASVAEAAGNPTPIEKTVFSCAGEPRFVEALARTGRRQAVLAGIETHVCVCQTAIDLLERGHEVFVVTDAVSSRKGANRALALDRLERAGAQLTSVEMALFELLRGSTHPRFREVQAVLK